MGIRKRLKAKIIPLLIFFGIAVLWLSLPLGARAQASENQRQIVFVHGIKTDSRAAQNCNNPGFQSIWCGSSYENKVNYFSYYQDIAYKKDTGGCNPQPAPDTNTDPLYAPDTSSANRAIDPNTCDSQSALAYNSTGLYNFLATLPSPVAIINHSMGAAITRGWMTLTMEREGDNTQNIVDTVISIQGVQQGSFVPLGVLPFINTLETSARATSSLLVSSLINYAKWQSGWDNNRPALADLTPGSEWYQSSLPYDVPSHLNYYNFYTDIKASLHPQFFFRTLPSIGTISFGDSVILPGESDHQAMPFLGGARFLPFGESFNRHEYTLESSHDVLLGDGLLKPLRANPFSIVSAAYAIGNDPIGHEKLNQHLDEDNNAFKVDSCRENVGKKTVQREILRILEDPQWACLTPGES